MDLSERKLKILKAIIDDYIATGIPVGSRTLSKKDDINYSSATIRNEMADLEEMGYLDKPHTSAGRTPSDIAYRLYVDRLMRINNVTDEEAACVQMYFNKRVSEIGQVIDTTAKVLSETTNHISLVTAPMMTSVKIKRIQLVKISENKAVLLIVTDSGLVKDVLINISNRIEAQELEMISNLLTEKVTNLTMGEAAKIIEEVCKNTLKEQLIMMNDIFEALHDNIDRRELVFGGTQNILNYPEYHDLSKAKHFLEILETKEMLYNMLKDSTDLEFSIKIGSENSLDDFHDMSIVTATYKIGDEKIGSFGVIGPTRMDYPKVLSLLNYVGVSLNEILTCFLKEKK